MGALKGIGKFSGKFSNDWRQSRIPWRRVGFSAAALCILLVSGGCSSSLFNDADKRLEELKRNNEFVTNCNGVNLRTDELDVPTTRNLVNCLNAHDAIPEFHNFVESLNDKEVASFIGVMNSSVLKNRRRLKELDLSFELLDQKGVFEPALKAMASVTANKTFISSILKLLKDSSFERAADGHMHIHSDLLKVLAIVSKELTRESLHTALDMSAKATTMKSFQTMAANLGSEPNVARLESADSLKTISDGFFTFALQTSKDPRSNLGKVFLQGMGDQSLLRGFDHYFNFYGDMFSPRQGTNRLQIDYQVASLNYFTGFLVNNNEPATFLTDLSGLFRAMNGPIACLENPRRISNGIMWVLDQITDPGRAPRDVPAFMARTNMIMLMAANSVCDLPTDSGHTLGEFTPAIMPMAESGSAQIAAELLTSLKKEENPNRRQYTHMMVDLLANRFITNLSPALRALVHRNVLADGLYFTNAFDPNSDRSHLAGAINVVMSARSELGGRSVFDVLVDRFGHLEIDAATLLTFYNVLDSFSVYLDKKVNPDPILVPLVTAARQALLYNNLNPVIDLVNEIAHFSEANHVFFETLFSAAEKPQFLGALDLTTRMSRDGSLKELFKAMLAMFRRGNENLVVDHKIAENIPPVPAIEELRNRSSSSLPGGFRPPTYNIGSDENGLGCATLNPDVLLSEWSAGSTWVRQIRSLAACINNNRGNSFRDVVSLVEYGLSNTMPDVNRPNQAPRSVLAYLVDLGKSLFPAASSARPGWGASDRVAAQRELGDILVRDHQDFKDSLGLGQLLIGRRLIEGGEASFLEEILKVAPRLMQARARPGVEKALALGGDAIAMENAPRALGYAVRKANETSLPNTKTDTVRLPMREVIASALIQHEGNTAEPLNVRVDRVYEDYAKLIRNDERVFQYRNNEDLKKAIWALLTPLARPAALEWTLKLFYKFRNNPYSPEWWAGWYKRLTEHYTVIPYYYPGATKPTLRIVNDLDRLEIMVIDADFKLSDYGFPLSALYDKDDNFAIKFLSFLGSSTQGSLDPAIDAMERELNYYMSVMPVLGVTMPQEVKNNLYNIKAVLPVMRELYKGPSGHADQQAANDVKVLTDLFHALISSTPPQWRETYDKEKHNLEVIVQLCHLGLLRNVSRLMQTVDTVRGTAQTIQMPDVVPVIKSMIDATIIIDEHGQTAINGETLSLLDFMLRSQNGRDLLNAGIVQFSNWSTSTARDPDTDEDYSTLLKRSTRVLFSTLAELSQRVVPVNRGLTTMQALVRTLNPAVRLHSKVLEKDVDLLEFVLLRGKLTNVLNRVLVDAEAVNQTPAGQDFQNLAVFLNWTTRQAAIRNVVPDLMETLDHVYNDQPSRALLHKARLAWNSATRDPLYESYRIEDIIQKFFYWFEGYGSSSRTPLAIRTQRYLGEKMNNGDVMNLLMFAGCHPGSQNSCSRSTELYDQLKLLGKPERIADLQDFLDLLHSAMEY